MEKKTAINKEYHFYLEEQLSWIGQTYDKTHWLYYNENMNAITLFLEENSGKPLSYEEQNNFTCKCVELMMKLPDIPRKIKALHNRILRAEKEGKQIKGKDVFNSSWEIMGIPYKITAKQKMKNKERETIWYINRTDNMSS